MNIFEKYFYPTSALRSGSVTSSTIAGNDFTINVKDKTTISKHPVSSAKWPFQCISAGADTSRNLSGHMSKGKQI